MIAGRFASASSNAIDGAQNSTDSAYSASNPPTFTPSIARMRMFASRTMRLTVTTRRRLPAAPSGALCAR
ncbi:MAG: hypothetical protein QM677_06445, partial [Microbacterium sp.]